MEGWGKWEIKDHGEMVQTGFEKHEQIIYFGDNFTIIHNNNEIWSCMEEDGVMSDTPKEHMRV